MADKPLHIAIIPDGNRRWARAQKLKPWKGHEKAVSHFRTVSEWCRKDPRVSILTVWCFSTENWKRDPKEISMLMGMLEDYLERERETWQKDNVRFCHSGRKDRIPESLAKLIAEVEEETKDRNGFTLHMAVDYGGKDEVVRALQKLEGDITQESIREHLDHPELPDIDLVIRSSGEYRTSNFFLWQSTYAEWVFLQKHFPEFDVQDLEEALQEFESRQRRHGA